MLLRAHEGGVEAMAAQARQIVEGTHPHQRALTSLIEDGAYHARLPRDIAAFQADPHEPARPIPAGLVDEADLMLAMDQFKDVRGLRALRVAPARRHGRRDRAPGWRRASTRRWAACSGASWDRGACGWTACDPELVRAPRALTAWTFPPT